MTPRAPSNYDLLTDLEANLIHATWIASVIDDWTGPSSSTGQPGQKGGHSDPTAATVLAGDHVPTDHAGNPIGADAWIGTPEQRLVTAAQHQLDDLNLIRQVNARMNARRNGTLNRPTLEQAKSKVTERTTPSTVGWCSACDRHQDGTKDSSKLVNGLCPVCRTTEYRAWQTAQQAGASNRQLHRDQWITAEKNRRAEQQHAS